MICFILESIFAKYTSYSALLIRVHCFVTRPSPKRKIPRAIIIKMKVKSATQALIVIFLTERSIQSEVCRFEDQSYLEFRANDLSLINRTFLFLHFWHKMAIMLQIMDMVFARACQVLTRLTTNASWPSVKRVGGYISLYGMVNVQNNSLIAWF